GEAIKAILAAASGGLTGTRLSVNQNIFKQQATDIFISQMETLRTQKREEIKGKLDKSITGYSLYEAFDDLLAYYDAGTTRAAYQTLQKGTAKAVPGAPTKVEAKPGKEEGTATVTFMPPDSNGGSPITGYTVTSHPAGGKDEDAGKTSTTHTVSELKSKAYTFTVTATNAAGTSAASAPSSSITPTSASAPPATKVPPATNASLAAKASTETPPTKTDDKTRLRQFLRQTGGADEIMECWKYENPALFKEGSDLPCAGGTPSAARLINAPECAGDQAKVRACLESRKK
ncbi:MAG TPA: fibronectin type III domain-containing protein, partial [Syntrophobacteraceae bacterium]|nr:fibronectin type III domain-containing protein [Syntrophobacteraceae bacterium]